MNGLKIMIDVSIIIVSYNTQELLKKCLESLVKYTKGVNHRPSVIKYEVIVVDNKSLDGSRDIVKKIKGIRLIENDVNLGFSKANNRGIALSKGRYVLLLNSDTFLHENSLGKMVEWMDKNPKVGISTCKLLNVDGSLQPTGGLFPDKLRLLLWSLFLDDIPYIETVFGSYHPRASWFVGIKYQDWVTGAFFLIRREVLNKLGGLDEDIFMYGEEMEFCYRASRYGWKIAYVPVTSITHIGRASGTSANAILGEYRSLIYFYKKHKSLLDLIFAQIVIKTGAIIRSLVYMLRMNFYLGKAYAKAITIH